MEILDLTLAGYQLVIIKTGIHVNTGWAFTSLQLTNTAAKDSIVKKVILQPITTWKNNLQNDFERPVFEHYPEIKSVKEDLYARGAIYASMSGSGSVVYGLFNAGINLTSGLPANYTVIGL